MRTRNLRLVWQLTAIVVMFQLIVVQAMASSGVLHKHFHDHADDSDHQCAVTMMLHGGYDEVVPDIVPVDVIPEPPQVPVAFAIAIDLVPAHLAGGVLAHAPPRGP